MFAVFFIGCLGLLIALIFVFTLDLRDVRKIEKQIAEAEQLKMKLTRILERE